MAYINLKEIERREVLPGIRSHFIHTDNLTIGHWYFEEGAELPEHSHMHEQITNVIDGRFEMTIGEETQQMSSGSVAVIPPDVSHHGKALTECYILDVFYPVREDFKNK